MGRTALADRAIRWYEARARDLPWRRAGTSPWAVLVSEVMLQQTPVVRVEPVWHEWLGRWPIPAALAAEPAGEAIRAWGRLGYPRRALRLHECARALVDHHDGRVPADLAALLALPGVGAYTARAVAVFAFGQRHPVVDTNVRRLIARAVSGHSDGGGATTSADLAAVDAVLPAAPARAAAASVAFMELGALVCTARAPSCDDCPLRTSCRWRSRGASVGRHPGIEEVPNPRPRRRPQRYLGTDRYVRGLLLAQARDAAEPIPESALVSDWPDVDQSRRALAGLVADGLLVPIAPDRYALPGLLPSEPAP
jgi:A/G-specific adenine glycosylase